MQFHPARSIARYKKGLEEKTESLTKACQRLGIDEDNYCCTILHTIPAVPVYLDGHLYDLQALEALPADSAGKRVDPLSNEKFELSAVQPARNICHMLEEAINKAEESANKFTC